MFFGENINIEDNYQNLEESGQNINDINESSELVIRQINSADNTFEFSKERQDYTKNEDKNQTRSTVMLNNQVEMFKTQDGKRQNNADAKTMQKKTTVNLKGQSSMLDEE